LELILNKEDQNRKSVSFVTYVTKLFFLFIYLIETYTNVSFFLFFVGSGFLILDD